MGLHILDFGCLQRAGESRLGALHEFILVVSKKHDAGNDEDNSQTQQYDTYESGQTCDLFPE